MTGGLIERKLFSPKREMTFLQNGALCHKNLPHFIAKNGWAANSPDVNPIEFIWRIIDDTTYKDPAAKMKKELKRRLHFLAWKNVTLDMLEELAHSLPRSL